MKLLVAHTVDQIVEGLERKAVMPWYFEVAVDDLVASLEVHRFMNGAGAWRLLQNRADRRGPRTRCAGHNDQVEWGLSCHILLSKPMMLKIALA